MQPPREVTTDFPVAGVGGEDEFGVLDTRPPKDQALGLEPLRRLHADHLDVSRWTVFMPRNVQRVFSARSTAAFDSLESISFVLRSQ